MYMYVGWCFDELINDHRNSHLMLVCAWYVSHGAFLSNFKLENIYTAVISRMYVYNC